MRDVATPPGTKTFRSFRSRSCAENNPTWISGTPRGGEPSLPRPPPGGAGFPAVGAAGASNTRTAATATGRSRTPRHASE